jgi:hypothetical protein
MSLPLPDGVVLSIDFPLTDSANENYVNPGRSPRRVGSAIIQNAVRRPGKGYAGYAPGDSNGLTQGRWSFGRSTTWNSMAERSFALQAWVYLPQDRLLPQDGSARTWQNNIIYGSGGPNSYGPRFGVKRVGSEARLFFSNELVSSTVYPQDQWVHVAIVYDHGSQQTDIYQNGSLVAAVVGDTWAYSGPSIEYNLGSAEFNYIYAMPWRGYISDFKLYVACPAGSFFDHLPHFSHILWAILKQKREKAVWCYTYEKSNCFSPRIVLPRRRYSIALSCWYPFV